MLSFPSFLGGTHIEDRCFKALQYSKKLDVQSFSIWRINEHLDKLRFKNGKQ